jgi:hypothetical protein
MQQGRRTWQPSDFLTKYGEMNFHPANESCYAVRSDSAAFLMSPRFADATRGAIDALVRAHIP